MGQEASRSISNHAKRNGRSNRTTFRPKPRGSSVLSRLQGSKTCCVKRKAKNHFRIWSLPQPILRQSENMLLMIWPLPLKMPPKQIQMRRLIGTISKRIKTGTKKFWSHALTAKGHFAQKRWRPIWRDARRGSFSRNQLHREVGVWGLWKNRKFKTGVSLPSRIEIKKKIKINQESKCRCPEQ